MNDIGLIGGANRSRGHPAFSLLELLVVLALIAVLAVGVVGGRDRAHALAVPEAQSAVAAALAAARGRAVATGRATRLLVNDGPPGGATARRYLRLLVVQEQDPAGAGWATVLVVVLPEGAAVMPSPDRMPTGLLDHSADWTTQSGVAMASGALASPAESGAVGEYPADDWSQVIFSPSGVPGTADGSIILAAARRQPPGNALPLILVQPEAARGVQLSRYGVAVPINSPGSW